MTLRALFEWTSEVALKFPAISLKFSRRPRRYRTATRSELQLHETAPKQSVAEAHSLDFRRPTIQLRHCVRRGYLSASRCSSVIHHGILSAVSKYLNILIFTSAPCLHNVRMA